MDGNLVIGRRNATAVIREKLYSSCLIWNRRNDSTRASVGSVGDSPRSLILQFEGVGRGENGAEWHRKFRSIVNTYENIVKNLLF